VKKEKKRKLACGVGLILEMILGILGFMIEDGETRYAQERTENGWEEDKGRSCLISFFLLGFR